MLPHPSTRGAAPQPPELPTEIWGVVLIKVGPGFPALDKASATYASQVLNAAATRIQSRWRCRLVGRLFKKATLFMSPIQGSGFYCQLKARVELEVTMPLRNCNGTGISCWKWNFTLDESQARVSCKVIRTIRPGHKKAVWVYFGEIDTVSSF